MIEEGSRPMTTYTASAQAKSSPSTARRVALESPVAPLSEPMTKFDLRHYERLAEGSRFSAKLLWRILSAIPFLRSGRMGDLIDRIWLVPSATVAGRVYVVELNTGRCEYLERGRVHSCPDKINHRFCTHFLAAVEKEKQYV